MGAWILIVHLTLNAADPLDNRQSIWMQEFGTERHCEQASLWVRMASRGQTRVACLPKGDSLRE